MPISSPRALPWEGLTVPAPPGGWMSIKHLARCRAHAVAQFEQLSQVKHSEAAAMRPLAATTPARPITRREPSLSAASQPARPRGVVAVCRDAEGHRPDSATATSVALVGRVRELAVSAASRFGKTTR